MRKCKFCMYRNGCGGELPGPGGKCMAFCVAKEDAAAYAQHLEAEEARKQYEREHYFDGIDACPDF